MKYVPITLFFLCMFSFSLFSDEVDTTADTASDTHETIFSDSADTSEEQTDTTLLAPVQSETKREIPLPHDEDELINPFVSESEVQLEGEEVEKEEIPVSDARGFNIIMDLSSGFSYTSLFMVTPEHYSLSGKYNFQFSAGAMVPFLNVFFARVSVSYFPVSYATSYTTPDAIDMYTKVSGSEELHFLSAPIDIGLRLDRGKVIPFVYCQFMPAFLTSAVRDAKVAMYATFSDTATLIGEIDELYDVTLSRERHQIFMGAGAGIAWYYGYGSVYVSGGVRFPLRDPGDENSRPGRTESSFINIPVSLGIRFYL